MSFVKNGINMPQTPRHGHQFKLCSKCNQDKPPEGGIEMSPTRWLCASCWTNKAIRRTYK